MESWREMAMAAFSPRARGCSDIDFLRDEMQDVFPACAGMFLAFELHILQGQGFPRVRGDVPSYSTFTDRDSLFSPRARGCSAPKP